ncbi:MAG: hypothetical protein H7339_05515 [Arcicella sp.]|nr:hypothetical protein [Arcicella sp.]
MKYFLTLLLSFGLIKLSAQKEIELPKEAAHFLLKNYSVKDYVEGDLNNDGRKDAILILNNNANRDYSTGHIYDAFIILIRDENNKLLIALRNDSLLMPQGYTAYYSGTEIKPNGAFAISLYGGRRDKWSKELTFQYKAKDNSWHLILTKDSGFDSGTMTSEGSTIIKEEELIGITAANYNYFDDGFDSTIKWKVTADKTFFYTNPDKNSGPRKGYLVKGDVIEVYSETTNFIQATFKNTSGYILKKDIQKIIKQKPPQN